MNNSTKITVIEYLRENFDLDVSDATGLIDSFIESVDDSLDKVSGLLAAQDWESLSRAGHSIKGSAANIGAESLRAAGYKLETGGKQADREQCLTSIAEIKSLINELR